eukprot:CAMPEP_0178432028 /NCGR_PEP_ID=MMETSP0689_2-20121128/32166_1 /TAXON_ID=160604 /ORGANISM="Amphidinium massartii, Strain CS-259" /LENGTH=186 /DNA_ID=CAMNT_0020053987 /DNA_START=84 /DNA_END=640 /DNA_ORIENTATION=-
MRARPSARGGATQDAGDSIRRLPKASRSAISTPRAGSAHSSLRVSTPRVCKRQEEESLVMYVHRHHHHHCHHHYRPPHWGEAAAVAESESLREFADAPQKFASRAGEHSVEGNGGQQIRHMHHHTHIAEKFVPARVRWLLNKAHDADAAHQHHHHQQHQQQSQQQSVLLLERSSGADGRTPGLADT